MLALFHCNGRSNRAPLWVGVAVTLALCLTGVDAVHGAAPAKAETSQPSTSTSYYLRTTRPKALDAMGCRFGRGVHAGKQPTDALVVMAFGRPRRKWGIHGASLFGVRFASVSTIRDAGVAFAGGFHRCVRHGQHSVRIVLGTSNFGPGVSYRHGQAWAEMVNQANERIAKRGWEERIEFAGGNDIELTWNGPKRTRAWVRGYDSVNRWPYYDFGDAAGCPPYGRCAGAWTLEDVWYVAWGAPPAIPLPEIYT
ncbi:MAG: hypothetical protein ABR518_05515, partial [Actinomycetota bacterium]